MTGLPGQGEALATWAVWTATTVATVVTYARLDPELTYNVHRAGLAGGLSRGLVHLNYPTALAALALVLVAMTALPRRGWLVAAPAIALCAVTPFVVDQADLDARWANAVPAIGVVLAASLTVAATHRAGAGFQPRRPGDALRLILVVVVVVLSLPWLSALVGFYFPGDVFMGEELFPVGNGRLEAAVHLGGHHGLFGALLLLTALALSRVQPPGRRLRLGLVAGNAALAGYGAINLVQDFWLEQVVKRGWVEWRIPSAVVPGLEVMSLVTLALAGIAVLLLLFEEAILGR